MASIPTTAQIRSAWRSTVLRPMANLLRLGVRCAFPFAALTVLAALLWSGQGRDVLRATIERAAGNGRSISDLVFLMVGSAALSLSLWYTMRWLLSAQVRSLPLQGRVAPLRTWLPRVAGAAAPALVAIGLYRLHLRDEPGAAYATVASHWTWGFVALAAALFAFYVLRGRLLLRMQARGLLAAGAQPAEMRRDDPMPPLTVGIVVWSVALTFGVLALFVRYPVMAPRVVGSTGVVMLALASINLFGSFVLSYWPLRHGLPHLAPWVLLAAGLMGAFNDNHVVQPAPLGADVAPPPRALPSQALQAWMLAHGHDRSTAAVPVVFVATEGGGLRAAYWTAAVLAELSRAVPALERHLFALSGVSGGSLGAAAHVAMRRDAVCAAAGALPAAAVPQTVQALQADFLSPLVGGLLFQDLAQRFIPWPFPALDRSRALEAAWQRAFARGTQRHFERPLHALYAGCPGLPRLLLNATVVETGQRAVLTDIDPRGFTDTLDVMDPASSASRQSLAGLVHHSARFPVLSPAGTIERRHADEPAQPWRRLVDGGYFDNSGAQTALELIRQLIDDPPQGMPPIRPILLVVRNDPRALSLCGTPTTAHACPPPGGADSRDAPPARAARAAAMSADVSAAPARLFPEARAPLHALFNARDAHAQLATLAAQAEVERRHRGAVLEFRIVMAPGEVEAPLGWALSKSTRRVLDAQAARLAAARQPVLDRLLQMPARTPAADCADPTPDPACRR